MMQMRSLEPVPATRFNFDTAMDRARRLGEQIAAMAKERTPFASLEERLLYYDALPYLGLSRAEERRLLADYATQALPVDSDPHIAVGLARADALAAAGKRLDSLTEVTKVYEAGIDAFEAK
jgi:hypothetical protein